MSDVNWCATNGYYLQVKQDGFFPADILFLASTNPDGVCYTEVYLILMQMIFP